MRSCPLGLLPVFVAISLNIERVTSINTFKHEQNVGTVLFERSDSLKHCWTTEEFITLNSRRMFQDLLPKVKVINYEDDRYIALLMDYFHICIESVRKLSRGKTKHLMLKALADTMGGYLQVYILPLTKYSYYAGNIKYRNARKLFQLYDELKIFLRTNGAGWMKPSQYTVHAKIPPIVITQLKSSVACDGIITYRAPILDHGNQDFEYFASKKKKRLASRRWESRDMNTDNKNRIDEEFIIVPLPFLDDNENPSSIALPFKRDSLQSLHAEKSAFVLVKYYVASVKCISSVSKTKKGLETFNKNFADWLQQSVRRHLEDDKWYPAFGGVLRIISALEESGIGTGITKWKDGGTYQMMPKIGQERFIQSDEGVPPLYKGESADTFGTVELISIAIVSALLVWLLVGLSLVCYRFLRRHSDDCSPCASRDPPVAVLYENTEYCEPDTCPSKVMNKRLNGKFKNWWRKKFRKCPGGCQDLYDDEEHCLAAINYGSKDTAEVSSSSKTCQKKKYSKSVSTSPSGFPRNRPSFRRVCYSSDASISTTTDSPAKPR